MSLKTGLRFGSSGTGDSPVKVAQTLLSVPILTILKIRNTQKCACYFAAAFFLFAAFSFWIAASSSSVALCTEE